MVKKMKDDNFAPTSSKDCIAGIQSTSSPNNYKSWLKYKTNKLAKRGGGEAQFFKGISEQSKY